MKHLAKTKLIWLAVALVPLLVAVGCGDNELVRDGAPGPPGIPRYPCDSEGKRLPYSAVNCPNDETPFQWPLMTHDWVCERIAERRPAAGFTCIERNGNFETLPVGHELLGEYPEYPPPGVVPAWRCEAVAKIRKTLPVGSGYTCIERNGMFVILPVDDELLDEYPEYPPPGS